MLKDGLSYPVRGDWVGRIVIGGVLGFLSVLVLPGIVVLGYLVRVLETTVSGADVPPEFIDWGDLLVTGIVGTLIALAYTVLPVVVYAVAVLVVFGTGGAIGGDAGAFVGVVGVLMALGFLPVLLLVYYAVPAALTAYAVSGDVGAAFDVARLKPTLLSSAYFVSVLMPLVVSLLLWVVTAVLAVTVVGLVLVPFVQFYGQVAVFRMFGSAFAAESDRIDAGVPGTGGDAPG